MNFLKVNPSTPRPEGRGLLEVLLEPRSSISPSKAGLRAGERVNLPAPAPLSTGRQARAGIPRRRDGARSGQHIVTDFVDGLLKSFGKEIKKPCE